MMRVLTTTLLLVATSRLLAEDITTTTGTTYSNVTVSRAEPDGLIVMTESGIEKLPFAILSKEIQLKYGYDPQKAASFSSAVQTAATQRQADLAAFQKSRQAQAAREEEVKARASRIKAQIVQVTKAGLLVVAESLVATGDSMSSIGGGGVTGLTFLSQRES